MFLSVVTNTNLKDGDKHIVRLYLENFLQTFIGMQFCSCFVSGYHSRSVSRHFRYTLYKVRIYLNLQTVRKIFLDVMHYLRYNAKFCITN